MARFAVRLTPRGGSDRIDGVADGVLLVRVRAAPVDGAANAALLDLLATSLGVPRSSLTIELGPTSRRKLIRVEGEGSRPVRDVAGGGGRPALDAAVDPGAPARAGGRRRPE